MATITYGTPVSLDLGAASVDLGTEGRDGMPIIRMVLDDGDGMAQVAMSPERAIDLADQLRRLATS